METTVRIVGFGVESVSGVLTSAENASIDLVDIPDLSNFDHGGVLMHPSFYQILTTLMIRMF